MKYTILQHPGHNRVYYNSADKLAIAELKIASEQLSVTCNNIEITEIGNVRYLLFETDNALSENDLQILSRLSFLFAIFRIDELNAETCLIPINKDNYQYLDSKISTLLKYHGKTNEIFTRMMINVALLSSDFDYSENIKILDPVAGKGTTLFEAAVSNFDVYGIEIEPKAVHETTVFFKKYLEMERLKHNSTKRQVYGTNKSNGVFIQEFEYARSKEEFKSQNSVKKLGIVNGNSKEADKYYKNEDFHLIAGDLPYGIVHGNTGAKKTDSIIRNPSELLNECIPAWYKVLKKGGVIVMAWNSFLVSRQKLAGIFNENGFEVLDQTAYNEFEHMVDKSIKRDIVVAKKG